MRELRFNLETAIGAWRRQFQSIRSISNSDRAELELHLRDHVTQLVSMGTSESDAFAEAMREMGVIADAESEYDKVYWGKLRRHRKLWRELQWKGAMLASYLKLAVRSLAKNKVSSAVNLAGLSIAIATSIVVYLFLQINLSMDSFHENADTTYLVGVVAERSGAEHISDRAPMALGPAMATDLPQIERAVRIENGGLATVDRGQNPLSEVAWFAESAFFDLFTFPLSSGTTAALQELDSVFLSAEAAERHFGDEPAVGEVLTITFGDDIPRPYVVRGVAEPFPANASFTFELLLNFAVGEAVGGDPSDSWRSNALATFIQLREGSALSAVKSNMQSYRAAQNAANDVWPVKSFRFTNLREVSRSAHLASVSISRGTDPANLFLFPLVALFLLALACFNYVNIALSQADRRLKEIGLRKAMGGRKGQLVVQFIGENLLLCFSALLFGIGIAQFFLLPGFNALFVDAEPLRLSLMSNPGVWVYLAAVLCTTGLVAGAFPAFYLASLAPAAIFRGSNAKLAGRRWIGNGLLAIQFSLAFLTMAGGVVFLSNAEYQADRDWGYEKDEVLVVPLARAGQFSILAEDLRQNAAITGIGGSLHHIMPRGSGPGGTLRLPSGQVDARRFDVNHEYLETMGVRLLAGRFFDRDHVMDATQAIIVNEEMARGLNLSVREILGQQFPWTAETTYTVVGVVEDFHSDDFSTSIPASLFRIGAPDDFQHLVIQANPGAASRVKEIVASSWERLFPGEVYVIFHQNEVFGSFFRHNRNLAMVFTFGALMALLISCMGLFGLASQNVARRTKEMSIRMVLGATFPQVATVMSRSFIQLLVAAALIALPASYFLLKSLLDSMYTYHITLEAAPFLLSALIVFATATLTVLTQLRKLAAAKPAVALRNA